MAATWLAAGGKLGFGVKPPVPTISRGHPLVRGLVFDANYFMPGAVTGNLERTGVSPRSTYTGTTATIGPHGIARTFPGSTATDRDTYVTNAAVNSLASISVEFLFRPKGTGGGNAGRIIRKGAANGRFNIEWDDATSNIDFSCIYASNDGDWTTPTNSLPVGSWYHVVCTYAFGTANNPTIYVNGVPVTVTRNTAPSGAVPTDTTSLIIGNREDFARCISADISHVRVWNRILVRGEVQQLYADPFQIYAPLRKFFAAAKPATGGGATYTPGAGSLAFTGLAPALTAISNLAPNAGSIAFTGYAPLLSQATSLTPGAGSITFTGNAPALSATQSLKPDAGSISFSGKVPSLQNNVSLTPGAGSVSFTGYAPALTSALNLTPGAGSIAFTGKVPALSATQALRPGVGGVVFTGYAPALQGATTTNLTPQTGALAFLGYSPHLDATFAVWTPVAPISEAWTPQPATGETWTPATPAAGSWSVSTATAEIWTPVDPNPEPWTPQ